MRRIGEIIAGQNRQIGQVMMIRSRWADIAGEVLAAHSEPVVIRNKVLQVLCDSPAWAQQVGMLSEALEKQLKKVAGVRVQKVEGKFGMVRKSPSRMKTIRPVCRPAIDPVDIEKLKDPRLAKVVRELASEAGICDD
ncbi:MAG TPA: DUF721 domain-containing protein [Deltaproteobacteria bacterium]|nr:DUF721 domain-containing protein [Deltaproteobacteria bacterium]HPR56637.1 DUF721 domain-containing protein [Deltaproteobacteria bacterium]HXK48723.1 DUF721 domain-containing protein [Deltaproteobacteria bacterium]